MNWLPRWLQRTWRRWIEWATTDRDASAADEGPLLLGVDLEAERQRRMALAYRWADDNANRYAMYQQFRVNHNSEGVSR